MCSKQCSGKKDLADDYMKKELRDPKVEEESSQGAGVVESNEWT